MSSPTVDVTDYFIFVLVSKVQQPNAPPQIIVLVSPLSFPPLFFFLFEFVTLKKKEKKPKETPRGQL